MIPLALDVVCCVAGEVQAERGGAAAGAARHHHLPRLHRGRRPAPRRPRDGPGTQLIPTSYWSAVSILGSDWSAVSILIPDWLAVSILSSDWSAVSILIPDWSAATLLSSDWRSSPWTWPRCPCSGRSVTPPPGRWSTSSPTPPSGRVSSPPAAPPGEGDNHPSPHVH